MTVKVRFAPSPTGRIHMGNSRMALINYLFALANKGKFLLRFDDTDPQRSKEEYIIGIREDLKWLGFQWNKDEEEFQSKRIERYWDIAKNLINKGTLYPCYETPEELEYKRKLLLTQGKPPIYDRSALNYSEADIKRFTSENRKPHYRFKMSEKPIVWQDLIREKVEFNGKDLSDPIVIRNDGSFLYMLPSVIDDIDMNITHIIRGEDHVSNAAIQTQMFEELNAKPPVFAHLPLITDIAGQGFSKRLGSLSINTLKNEGFEAMAVASFMKALGTSNSPNIVKNMQELAENFSLNIYGRATAKFDPEQLNVTNTRFIHSLHFADVKTELISEQMPKASEQFWKAIVNNITKIKEAKIWYEVIYNNIKITKTNNPELIKIALTLIPQEEFDNNSWSKWTKAISTTSQIKGRELFNPLRIALTGYDHGPELKSLLPLIGKENTIKRLQDSLNLN